MRYMLPVYPLLTLMAAVGVLAVVRGLPSPLTDPLQRVRERGGDLSPVQNATHILHWLLGLLVIVLGGTIFQGLALLTSIASQIHVSRLRFGYIIIYVLAVY